jgi:hypothetical protein
MGIARASAAPAVSDTLGKCVAPCNTQPHKPDVVEGEMAYRNNLELAGDGDARQVLLRRGPA